DELGDLARLDAAGADLDAPGGAVDDGAHTLDVGVPPALGAPVRVADTHAPRRVLAAHLADGCHDASPQGSGYGRTERLYWRPHPADNSLVVGPDAGRTDRARPRRPGEPRTPRAPRL